MRKNKQIGKNIKIEISFNLLLIRTNLFDYIRLMLRTMTQIPSPPAAALRLIDFINASPTPFHCVHESVVRLEKADFTRLSERDNWAKALVPGGKYFITRNQSSIVAFTVPPKIDENKAVGMSIIGCHTDSPRFIIKPVCK